MKESSSRGLLRYPGGVRTGSLRSSVSAWLVCAGSLSPAALAGPLSGAQDADPPDFAREVLPILSDKCFTCHGPDPSSRRAGLRLDLEEAARESGMLDVAEDGSCELTERLVDDDPSWRMPPPEAKNDLSDAERDVLRRWVEAGAPYGKHWAFEPLPAEVPVPDAGGPWALSPLDRFVAARRDAAGLEPAAAASPGRWLRRVTFDLTGLPPTPEELDRFLVDPSPAARAAVVDRLMSSPSYGERMATPWLDVARYADSYGYQSDQLSPTWPYRDWVVAALNANKPYDQFLTEQLAGDLLENPTPDQRLATAFNRLHRLTNEGGSVEQERRYESVVDRVETLGTAVMGLTLGCARCHDHKYDPISQADFFALSAFFNGIDEWGMYNDSAHVPTPSLLLPTLEQDAQLTELERGVVAADAALAAALEGPLADLAPGASEAKLGPSPLEAGPHGPAFDLDFAAAASQEGGGRKVGDPGGVHANVPGQHAMLGADAPEGAGVRFDGDTSLNIPGAGPTGPNDAFTLEVQVTIPEGLRDGVLVHRTSGTDVGFFGFDLMLVDGYLRARQVRFWPGNAAAIVSDSRVPTGRPVTLLFAQDGTGWAEGMTLAVDGEFGHEVLVDRLEKPPQAGGQGLSLGARFRSVGTKGAVLHRARRWNAALDEFAMRRVFDPRHGVGEGGLVLDEVRGAAAASLRERSDEIAALRKGLSDARRAFLDARARVMEISVMEEAPWADGTAHVLERGDYDAPRTEENRVSRRAPASLSGGAETPLADRLALAGWLTAPDHPLTARVAVNRLWQVLFGAGLVGTAGDFGLQGTLPSHPALLDWLARRFVDSGWDQKALIKEIVLSATYGQDSAGSSMEADPENLLLARGPRRRLTAEMLRDAALLASGLLEERLGGPPVSPYQPPGLWRESNSMSPAYRQSVGVDLHRRSLYSVVKRTAPLPNMLALDAPTRETSCARREQTSTPLQGLVLLNDVQFVEACRAMAARAMGESTEDSERVASMFRRLAGREPDETEAGVLQELLASERAAFTAAPEEASALIGVGESEPGAAEPVELASFTVVAQVIFNLDAVVTLR